MDICTSRAPDDANAALTRAGVQDVRVEGPALMSHDPLVRSRPGRGQVG
jgi:hypothetical protein